MSTTLPPPRTRVPARGEVGRLEESSVLDHTDRRILKALCEDGRLSIRALAERVGVSRASAYNRLQRLEDAGIIKGFTAQLDTQALGLSVAALIIVTLNQHSWRPALDKLHAMPEVAYCAVTAAEFDAVLIVRAPNVDSIRDVVLERLHQMPEIRRTRTMLVLDEVPPSEQGTLEAFAAWSARSGGALGL